MRYAMGVIRAKGDDLAPGSRSSGGERLEMFQFVAATVNRLAIIVKRPVDRLPGTQKPVQQGTCGTGAALAGLIRTIGGSP